MSFRKAIPMPATASRIALAAAALAVAVPAHAQATQDAAPEAAQAGNAGQVEEIVVTAQFRAQNLQNTPLAITAVSGAMMEARSQTSIASVADQAPSVTLKPQGAAYGPSLGASIRGIGQFDFNPALEPGVGVYVDDVYYATLTGSVFDLLDLDRVEVLRGPQGTLAGKNSIGGAIKLYSKKPEGSNTGYLQATYGSRHRMDLRGSADIKLLDNLFARVSGVAKKQDGYINRYDYGCLNPGSGVTPIRTPGQSCLLGREGEVNYQAVRGQLRWEATSDIEVNVIGDYTHDERRNAGSVLTYANYTGPGDINPFPTPIPFDSRFICGKYCNYATYISLPDGNKPADIGNDGRTRFVGWGVSGNIDWKLADSLKLVSITAYRAYNMQFNNDDDLSPLAHSFGLGNLTFWSVSQELRLNGSIGSDKAIEYTLGGFYMDQKSTYATFQDLRYASAAGLTFQGDDPVNANTKAVFAHATWHTTDKLSLTGGIRYTREHKDYTFSRKLPDGVTPANAVDGQVGNYGKGRVDYRANIQYDWTRNLMTYAQFSTGFKGGGISPRPFNAAQVRSFGPETLKSWEVGVKSDLFDRHVRLNLAGFYSDYSGIQLSLNSCPQYGGPGPCALVTNAGDATIKGFEIETSVRPVDGLMIDGSLSYLDFQYKSGSINPGAGGPTNPRGIQYNMVPPYVPSWKWSIGAQYEVSLGDSGSLTPRIDASYQSRIFSNAVNGVNNRIPGYTVANARLTYRNSDGDWEIAGEITNLFDKYYFLTSFDLTGAGAGVASAQPGRPREFAISVKKKF